MYIIPRFTWCDGANAAAAELWLMPRTSPVRPSSRPKLVQEAHLSQIVIHGIQIRHTPAENDHWDGAERSRVSDGWVNDARPL